jgi:glycosyltransferase involved in cell wall biosynthesis
MRFSIVTPVYNGERFIAETIQSILSQEGDFEIDYIIQDGGSTDGTLAIVKTYEEKLTAGSYPINCNAVTLRWFSEKDAGMYDAVQKGFAHASGDICCYLNADDRYLPGAFAAVAKIFATYPDVSWVKGINTSCDEDGTLLSEGACRIYLRQWLQKGVYGRSAYFVDQESVFWRRSLWDEAKPELAKWRLAGDYALWTRFAHYATLWSFNRPVSIFRRHRNQLSASMDGYRQEQEAIAPKTLLLEKRAVLFFSLVRLLRLDPKSIVTRMLFATLFPFREKGWYIDFDQDGQPKKRSATSYVA